ncbi:quinone oxidoreductase putative [Cryphonectria parasitica EP155]|uniref:Quinone oxidoreductase putative n=1 Tax=Cryphonectria parasitica (strain ATCC 38755 / EP155) TaxID=660469 RepID=A0A9P4Y2S9_CRYP1|nr:quinone oxidoreductase putative [Cryphonectria parasitica EP155]KAF3765598.1 quinone oxidoreductase putative [Cryphonectria parasitica EP155]
MKAIRVKNGKGDADALYVGEAPDPTPGPRDVLIVVKAFGLNRMDIMQREAKYPYALLPESGDIMGVEFSGVVKEIGAECTSDFKVGDRVFGLAYGGAYAELIAVSEGMLMHMPPATSFQVASGIPETFFTAIQAVHLVGSLQPGQTVLVHAGASGVGQAVIQIAKAAGAKTIFTTAGTDDKCNLCRSLGADFAVNYKTGEEDFADTIARETGGKGVNLIVDLVGRDYWDRNVASAAMDSRIVLVALLSGGVVDNFNLRQLMNKRIWVQATTLRTRNKEYQQHLRDVFTTVALPELAKGIMKITVDKVFRWTDIAKAHKRMESNVNAGKIICVIG